MALLEINWRPERRQLRGFGVVCLVACAAVGGWVFFRHSLFGRRLTEDSAQAVAACLWLVGVGCGLLAAARPAWLRPIYLALAVITFPIGLVLSYVLIAVLFYGVFTPIGLVLRLVGRDPLKRQFDPDADTYWEKREPVESVERYFRQF